MSQFPPLKAPDGFELGVFARTMLSQLPEATTPVSFEADVMQKAGGVTNQQPIRPQTQSGISWKTTLASLALLATLASVTWFTGVWDSYSVNSAGANEQVQVINPVQPQINPEMVVPTTTDIKKADQKTKSGVIKGGKRAINDASKKVFAGHNN